MIRILFLTAAVSALAFASGCRHKCCLNDPGRQPKPYLPQAPNSPFLLPPAGVPTTPVPVPGPSVGVPPVGPADLRNYPPSRPAPEVLLPEPIPGGASNNPTPNFLGGPMNPTVEPPVTSNSGPTAGLPSYVRVREGVASGRRPTLDGFDTLKLAKFRTVIYLHGAGADVSAPKEVATKRGLAFVAIEATPEKLATAIEQFNAVLADAGRQPIYVFDEDGVRAGAIWYLHFRTAESMNDDAAQVRARPLGLSEQGEEAKAFALATQKYLEVR